MLLGQAWRGARRRSARHRRRSTLGRPSLLPACACGLGYDGHVLLARRRRRATLKSAHLGVLDRVDMPVGRRLSASHRLTPSLGWRPSRRCRVLRRQHYKRDACSIRLVHLRAPSTCERRIADVARRAADAVSTMAAAAAHTELREGTHGRRCGRHESVLIREAHYSRGPLVACLLSVLAFLTFFTTKRIPPHVYPQAGVLRGNRVFLLCASTDFMKFLC